MLRYFRMERCFIGGKYLPELWIDTWDIAFSDPPSFLGPVLHNSVPTDIYPYQSTMIEIGLFYYFHINCTNEFIIVF